MLLLLLACTGPEPAEVPETHLVIATSFPAWYLADQLAIEQTTVRCILPPGEDPQTWQPDGAQIASLGEADLIVSMGGGFEAWMATAALPERRVVSLAEVVEPIILEGATHSHGVDGEHSHAGRDPHTWTDPTDYLAQHAALAAAFSEHQLPTSGVDLSAVLQQLEADYAAVLSDSRLPPLYGNHPAWHHLARHHGLTIPSLDLDPDVVPAQPPALPEGAVLLWESAPSPAVAAAISARHVVFDPLEQPPEGGTYDYPAQSATNIARLQELLAASPSGDHSQP